MLWAILLLFFPLDTVGASSDITATVKLSVCGDLIAEGDEQCDNDDFAGQTCRTLGYYDGDLTCDPACDFDTTACYGVAPTPTPTPTPTSKPSSDSSDDDDSVNTSLATTPAPVASVVVVPTAQITKEVVTATPLLPVRVAFFDSNSDGAITRDELDIVVSAWVNEWRTYVANFTDKEKPSTIEKCDLNLDSDCDLIDFSVLLYYVS